VLSVDDAHGMRRKSTGRQLDKLDIDWEFVDGFLTQDPNLKAPLQAGLKLSSGQNDPMKTGQNDLARSGRSDHQDYSSLLNLLLMKRSMTAGEISVYRGHRKIWRKMLDDEHDVALILEDDFAIQDIPMFLTNLRDAHGVADRWDLVKFFDFSPKPIIKARRFNQTEFAIYKHPSSGMVAYLMSRKAAQRLLMRPKIYRPVDEDLSYPWESKLRIFSIVPNPISEQSQKLGGSLLEEGRLNIRVQHRSTPRSVYGNLLSLRKRFYSRAWVEEMKEALT